MTARPGLADALTPLLRAYAAVLFCTSPRLGAWLALLTAFTPRAALAGGLALLAAALWGRLLGLSRDGEAHLINSLLCGLLIGAFHVLDLRLLGWIIVVALLVTLFAHWWAALLWHAGRLPLLSLPFVLVSWLLVLATPGDALAMLAAPLSGYAGTTFAPWADGFFTALGWLLLVPYPAAGALIFAGLLGASRYLALLAISGYLAGQAALWLFGRSDAPLLGFNFMLAAMALGGMFAIPGRASFAIAVGGGALAGWIAVALGSAVQIWQLPLLTLPFILAVWIWLGALGQRSTNAAPILLLDAPAAPEHAFERWRLAHVRGISDSASVALNLPFFGEWRVTQGFNGHHTHQAEWRHALDFEIHEGELPGHGSGDACDDYFCFGAPLLAPIAGQVITARDDLPDMPPGTADLDHNWGNYLVLRSAAGAHVLLAHLRQGSLQVGIGAWVGVGQIVAACGSSGRAPVPHLHLQVQAGAAPGSPTQPFHLLNVLVHRQGRREFHLCHQAQEGDRLSSALHDEALALAVSMPANQTWRYEMDGQTTTLRSELTLLGQARLFADNGASVAYEANTAAIGYFDRNGRHPLLDLWVLALGLTPLSAAADVWEDRPPLALLPLGTVQRLLAACLFPLGAACHSRYHRHWDAESNVWCQQGEHRFQFLPGITWQAKTSAWITPHQGVQTLQLEMFGYQRSAHRLLAGTLPDQSSPTRRSS